jgi:hypothetical protein
MQLATPKNSRRFPSLHSRAKTAWQQGRKELFYPYGKTFLQTLGEHD